MLSQNARRDPASSSPPPNIHSALSQGDLSPAVTAALWRGTELGTSLSEVVPSGWLALDNELPGAGWPCQSLIEVLCPQPSILEWRLLGPALRQVVSKGGQVIVVGPPKQPHLPGLRHEGLDQRHLVWIRADAPAQRLWVTEQLIRSNSAAAILSWLPQARADQIRRLQLSAQTCDGLVFLFRPEAAQHEASAAPLRLKVTYGLDWELRVNVFKRRGPLLEGFIALPSIPGGLASVLTPRIQQPSTLFCREKVIPHAVGSPAPGHNSVRQLFAH